MAILWFSVWMSLSWCFVMLPSVHPEKVFVKDDDIKHWYKDEIYSKGSGEGWQLTKNEKILGTCGIGNKADFWTITPHIDLNKDNAEVIIVDVEAELTPCFKPGGDNVKCFSNYFEVYIYRGKNAPTSLDLNSLTEIFQPLYNITNDTSPNSILTRSIKTFSFPQNHSQGVTFAIRSRGACGLIFRIKMYYYYCKEIFINGLQFENTISPAKGFKTITTKNCSNNSVKSINAAGNKTITSYIGYCFANGTWSIPQYAASRCLCREGYTLTDGSCASCSGNNYKKNISNENCSQCPMNTKSNINKTSCDCEEGYYKDPSANSDPSPCYALLELKDKPSRRLLAGSVEITWTNKIKARISDDILREIIRYDVRCYKCNQSICNKTSCMNETYEPGQNNLIETKVIVSNLTMGGKYVFRVYAKNSLNDNVPQKEWKYVETDKVVIPSPVEPDPTTGIPSDDTSNVSANNGHPGYVIAIAGGIPCFLLVVVVGIVFRTRRRQSTVQKHRSREDNSAADDRQNLHYASSLVMVSPRHLTETEYAEVLEDWEISPNDLKVLNKKLGAGQFGVVKQGLYTPRNGDSEKVAIKMLKENASELDLSQLLAEIKILKEANKEQHPNIIKFIGSCFVKGRLVMVTEFCPGGNLRRFLIKSRINDDSSAGYVNKTSESDYANVNSMLSHRQLLKFAVDVACGMVHLSSQNFLHRDLAARNILLGEENVAKICDFGLARDVGSAEEYIRNTQHLLPVKWMSLESLFYGVFTTASDVWSFGVLLYEITTLGEEPYKNIPARAVITHVESGGRMLKPPHCSNEVYEIMSNCWKVDPKERPTFPEILQALRDMLNDREHTYINVSQVEQ